MTTEHKDVQRIDDSGAESKLIKRQLGFAKTGAEDSSYKMKYKTPSESIIEFTPDTGDATFNSVEITGEISKNNHAVDKAYVDGKISEGNISDARPMLNGFVYPNRVSLVYDESNKTLTFNGVDEEGNPASTIDYYVKGEKYQVASGQAYSDSTLGFNNDGCNFLFLDKDATFHISTAWDSTVEGLLPLLVAYRGLDKDSVSKILSMTPDYHGTEMDNATKHFINANNGLWIEWGLDTGFSGGQLDREKGVVINEDVAFEIPALNSENGTNQVRPAILYLTDLTYGEEKYSEHLPAGIENWKSLISLGSGTYFQDGNEMKSGSGGGWFLYFVRPDLRNGEYDNDVLIPLDFTCSFEDRYNFLDESVRKISNHYYKLICDWKVLGLVFLQDGDFKDYLKLGNFELKDLLYGCVMNKSILPASEYPHKVVVDAPDCSTYTSHNRFAGPGGIGSTTSADEVIGVLENTNRLTISGPAKVKIYNEIGRTLNSGESIEAGTKVYGYHPSEKGAGFIKSIVKDSAQENDVYNDCFVLAVIEKTYTISQTIANSTSIGDEVPVVVGNVIQKTKSTGSSSGTIDPTLPSSLTVSGLNYDNWDGEYTLKGSYYQKGTEAKYIGNGHSQAVWVIASSPDAPYYQALNHTTALQPHYQNWVTTSRGIGVATVVPNDGSTGSKAFDTNGDIVTSSTVQADAGFVSQGRLGIGWSNQRERAEIEVAALDPGERFVVRTNGEEKLLVNTNGAISAPAANNSTILSESGKVLITKEYADAYYAGGGGASPMLTYGFSRISWTNGGLFGPNGSNDTHGSCSHIVFRTGTITQLSYYFEGHNTAGSIVVHKNETAVYTSPSIAGGTYIKGLLNGLNVAVTTGDEIKITVNGGGQRGQITMVVEG